MKLRTVGRLGAFVSILLFCIGVGVYSFVQLTLADKDREADLLSLVSGDCIGLLETDNFDYMLNEFPQAAYAEQLDTLHRAGLLNAVFGDLARYASDSAHGLGGQMSRMMVSFHAPVSPDNVVVFFRISRLGKQLLKGMMQKNGMDFSPKRESYRGKEIEVYPTRNGNFISVYGGDGFLAFSYQKRLIEKVIDAVKDHSSLKDNEIFMSGYHSKSANFMTLYGRTVSIPLLAGHEESHCWSEFDIHLNSEVFYLSGSMYEPDSCIQDVAYRLDGIKTVDEDSILVLSGAEKVDSCVSSVAAAPRHSLFDECISNLSRDASYIMVADMDKVARDPKRYAPYLPVFIQENIELFRPFILSVQITKVNNRLSHIFVFVYKE